MLNTIPFAVAIRFISMGVKHIKVSVRSSYSCRYSMDLL